MHLHPISPILQSQLQLLAEFISKVQSSGDEEVWARRHWRVRQGTGWWHRLGVPTGHQGLTQV